MRARLLFCGALLVAGQSALALQVGDPLPAFSAQRLDADSAVQSAALAGKVVYVDFWASWCGPCKRSMPWLAGLRARLAEKGFEVVGINKDTEERAARRFLDSVKVGFPLVRDSDDALAKAFKVAAMPSGYLVDRKGRVRSVHRGFDDTTPAKIEAEVMQLVAEP